MGLLNDQTQKAYYEGSSFGNYQFTSLDNIIDQFIIAYVGEDKIIDKAKRTTVQFHAQRALQELSFDTFKSTKAQEIEVPPSLQMVLPQDYVNYVKLSFTDSAGIQHVLYPALKTSNPTAITQDVDGVYQFTGDNLTTTDSDTWTGISRHTVHVRGAVSPSVYRAARDHSQRVFRRDNPGDDGVAGYPAGHDDDHHRRHHDRYRRR